MSRPQKGEGNHQPKTIVLALSFEECPEHIMFPGKLAILLFGPLKENISDGKNARLF